MFDTFFYIDYFKNEKQKWKHDFKNLQKIKIVN